MATLERGKGKRKQAIEITRHGDVLRMREVEAGDRRLPGYRRCADEAAAAAVHLAEVRTLVESGMTPADDAAQALAAALPAKPAGKPSLPIRADLGIDNEATGFVVTSRKMAGTTLDEGSVAWKKAVRKGQMLPVQLIQDDAFIVRVVAGGALTPDEEAEWVARIDWHLNVPDGRLCVTGGAEFTNEGYDADDPSHERFVGELEIPRGVYRASLYCCAHGVNGDALSDDLDAEFVDFLLHLEPVAAAPKSGLSELPDEGWFTGAENARMPADPPGLSPINVIRKPDEPPGAWTFVRDVFELLKPPELAAVTGGAVEVPLDAIGQAARIAWLGSRFVVIELRLAAPPGAGLDLAGVWPEGVVAVVESGTGRILFSNDLDFAGTLEAIRGVADRLNALPAGTRLDMCTAALEVLPGSPEGAGRVWFRGPIRDGHWRIAEASPAIDAAKLASALAFAGEIDRGARTPVSAIPVFAERFSSAWPVVKLPPPDDDDDDGLDDEDDGMFPTTPIKGAEVLVAPSGRTYHATMAALLSQKIGEDIAKLERALRGTGFKHAGDVVCSADDRVAWRGYVKPGGHAWAYFRVAPPAEIAFAIATRFAGGKTMVSDGEPIKDIIDDHDRRVGKAAARLGPPKSVEFKLADFADTVEAVLLRPAD